MPSKTQNRLQQKASAYGSTDLTPLLIDLETTRAVDSAVDSVADLVPLVAADLAVAEDSVKDHLGLASNPQNPHQRNRTPLRSRKLQAYDLSQTRTGGMIEAVENLDRWKRTGPLGPWKVWGTNSRYRWRMEHNVDWARADRAMVAEAGRWILREYA